jgi:hypothetical protein
MNEKNLEFNVVIKFTNLSSFLATYNLERDNHTPVKSDSYSGR